MLVFTEPSAQYPRWSVLCRNASVSAATSIGSPIRVAVPCASTSPIVPASISPCVCAARITSVWPAALGAVNPTLRRPSLFTAEPRTTARIRSPSATASSSRFSTTAPTPSPEEVPAASAAKARQRPSGENGPSGTCRYPRSAEGLRDTAPASARSHRKSSRSWQAVCSATSAVEHAVWSDRLGPVSPSS